MNVPEVKFIRIEDYKGVVGDKIIIRAVDDFRVLRVLVEIHTSDGSLIESGNATQNVNGIDWTYTVTKINNLSEGSTIKAIATDVPGNEGILVVKS